MVSAPIGATSSLLRFLPAALLALVANMKRSFILLILLWLLAAASLAGCTFLGVDVWERDILAKSEMQLDGNAVDRALDDHIYFSKEASSGGRGFGGGGCGCN